MNTDKLQNMFISTVLLRHVYSTFCFTFNIPPHKQYRLYIFIHSPSSYMIDEIDIFDTMSHKKKKHLHKLLLRKGVQNTHTNTRRDTIPTIAYIHWKGCSTGTYRINVYHSCYCTACGGVV